MLFLCVLASALTCFGQESRATLTGTVTDPNGAAVPNATVTITNQQTNLSTTVTTTGEGNYTATPLLPGLYTVVVEAQGFKRTQSDQVQLSTATTTTFDVALEIGAVGDTVMVVADAPVLEADTASRGQVVERERISELPLVGRNPINLATLAPGVTFNGNPQFNRPFDNGDNVNFSINGGLNRHNDFTLDGVANNAITDANATRTVSSNNIAFIPSSEATQEFKVQTNSYDAQYGRTGGGTVNVSIRAGGSQYHGSLYEFARRYQFNANSFSNNARGTQLTGPCAGQEASPRFTRDQITCENLGGNKIDQYGFVFSGPLRIPRFGEGGKHFYNGSNNTFFLVNIEKYKELSPGQGFSTVPTLLERQGDFSQSGVTIFDPLTTTCNAQGVCTRQPFPGNVIPASRISPVGAAIVSGFSLPNTGSATQRFNNFYLSEGLGTDDFYSNIARVDHRFSDRESMFVRFVNNRRDQFAFGGNNRVGLGIDQQGPLVRQNYGVVIDSTTTVNSTTILNVRLGFARFLQAAFRQASSPFDATSIGFSPAFSAARPVSIVPRITFNDPNGGIPEFGSRNPNSNITNTWSVPAYLTKITGNHTFRFGGEWRRFQVNQSGGSFNFGGGAFCFTNFYTSGTAGNRGSGGAAFADLLLGAPTSTTNSNFAQCNGNAPNSQLENVSPTTFEWSYLAGYVQDDWKLTPKLTLNLGFRYDYEQPPVERFNRQNRGFAFDQANPLAAAVRNASAADCPACANLRGGLVFAGVNGLAEGAFEPDRNNFQPRVGVAYQWNEKTVIRGGYGLFYYPSAEYGGASGFSVITPYSSNLGTTGAAQFTPRADAFNNPFPTGLTQPTGSSLGLLTQLGSAVTFVNPNREIPYIHQYSLGIQRELPWRTKLDISYVGSASRRILTGDQQGAGARNINVNTPAQLARFRTDPTFRASDPVTNPFAGLIPSNPALNGATIRRDLLLLPFPQFGAVNFIGENVGTLDYNSLQASLEKRLSRGLVGVVSYTFSKNIGALGFLNNQDTTVDNARAVVDFDSPHVLAVSAVYNLPFGKGRHYLSNAGRATELLVGGFEYSVITNYRSGRPIPLPSNADLIGDPHGDRSFSNPNVPGTTASFINNCVMSADGTSSTRPATNAAGARNGNTRVPCTNPAFRLRDTALTLRSIPLRLGNLREPSATTFDMALNKSFNFTESVRFQFRVEFFNAFNTPLFGSPDTGDAGSQTFGVLNPNNGQRNIPRQIQLGFKLMF
ncbi:MAG: carboxypeptidase regulatory-like domain-containing protein [Pyrinomonadaceae bacterium]